MALLFVMGLLHSCDKTGTEAGEDSLANPETLINQTEANKGITNRVGPHKKHDPHANLSADKQAQIALQHLDEGRLELALETLSQAINKFPDADELLGIRGSLMLQQGDISAALADIDAAISLAPHNPLYLVNRAQAYRGFRRTDEALLDLERAIELDPGLMSAHFNRGAILLDQGDFEGAIEEFDQCIVIDPHVAASYFNRAAAYSSLGKTKLAIADLERFIRIAPSDEWKGTAYDLLKQWRMTKNKMGRDDS